jgi:tetratricopeptide (TPR) repeat protein
LSWDSNKRSSWEREATAYLQEERFEEAARLFRRAAEAAWLMKDLEGFKELMEKAGRNYAKAAEPLWVRNPYRASRLCRAALSCLLEAGRDDEARVIEDRVRGYYLSLLDGGFRGFEGASEDIKDIGDYFRLRGDDRRAIASYLEAAERAAREGRTLLAASLYRNAGDCYLNEGLRSEAAESFAKAAEKYLLSADLEEAAWNYSLAALFLISLLRIDEGRLMARSAYRCQGETPFPSHLRGIILICLQLAEGRMEEASYLWGKIRSKFRPRLIEVVEECLASLASRGNRMV